MSTVALIAVLVIDRIVGMLKTRGIDLRRMAKQLQDLHEWHDIRDPDGVFKWMVRQSLEKAITDLQITLADIMKLGEKLDRRLERIENENK